MMEVTKLKKSPKQLRSRFLVDSIFSATSDLLSKRKPEEVTTDAIVKRAGVGIGSLYDYFKSKDNLFVSLLKREIEKNLDLFSSEIDHLNPEIKTSEDYVKHFVRIYIQRFLSQGHYMRSLLMALSRKVSTPILIETRKKVAQLLTQDLSRRFPEEFTKDGFLEIRLFLVVNAFLENLQTYLHLEPLEIPLLELESFLIQQALAGLKKKG